MTLSLQEISDRFELQDLIVAYSTSVDTKDWTRYESLFTPDAVIDYTEAGGVRGQPKEVAAWLGKVMPNFPAYQHMISNVDLTISGDEATGRTMLFNPMGCTTPTGMQVALIGPQMDAVQALVRQGGADIGQTDHADQGVVGGVVALLQRVGQ